MIVHPRDRLPVSFQLCLTSLKTALRGHFDRKWTDGPSHLPTLVYGFDHHLSGNASGVGALPPQPLKHLPASYFPPIAVSGESKHPLPKRELTLH